MTKCVGSLRTKCAVRARKCAREYRSEYSRSPSSNRSSSRKIGRKMTYSKHGENKPNRILKKNTRRGTCD